MYEQSSSEISSSIWASMNSWFTPAVFFLLLNIMIGTIILTSTPKKKSQNQNQNQNQNETHHQPKFAGSVLQRLKSTNFLSYYNNRSQDPQNSSIYKQAPDSETHFNPEHTQNHETEYFFQENSAQDLQNSSIYKQAPDSRTHFNPKHTQNHEIDSHYFFQENSAQDPQNLSIGKKTPDSDSELSQNHETQSHYFFQENLQISQSQASNSIFEQTDEKILQESQTHFSFEQKDSNLDDFEQAPEEKVEDSEPSEQSMDEVYSQLTQLTVGHSRTKSETAPASGKIPRKLPAKMKKSASLISAFGHFEEEKIVEARRPETVRENTAKVTDGDEGVDAKADDFIHKFKQQLKLQRLDSIVRYKDMIGRGVRGGN
ncbi:hypothetical protein CASFOL_011160 [Castilleja foliolosa]|uniref:DUF4408 domain-containing protein n=1 Tax=Castilleja foliolosa TaxID=1961234 RepID=A0ABD3DUQ8_9LAMI